MIASLLRQVTNLECIIALIEQYIFNEKRKSCDHQCPDSVYFHKLLFIIYLSAIEGLICRREMSLIGSTSFGFAQNTMHDFQNTVLNSWWHCFRQMPQKNDKPRIFLEYECIFLPVNVTFFDAVSMTLDAIRTANPFQNTAKFMFVGARNDKTQQIRRW